MASNKMKHGAFDPGVERGGGDYEELMPEHLLKEALRYLSNYVRSRKLPGIVLTVYANGSATIWGEDAFSNLKPIMESLDRMDDIMKREPWGDDDS